jgi:hypothetical protein
MGIPFWDGGQEKEVNKLAYDQYLAIQQETGRKVILSDTKITEDEYMGKVRKLYSFRLDTYNAVGVTFQLVSTAQYEAIQKYQDEHNVQIIYPITDPDLRPAAEQDEKNANFWFKTKMGAGRKTENNTFEGVLMGDVVVGADMDTYHTTARGNASGIGLYGFNDGAQSFYFGVDGTAFLGKATSGRINFDGNNGFIYSQQWLNSFRDDNGTYVDHFITKTREDGSTFKGLKPGKSGLAIDLQSGHIDAYDFKVTSKNIYLNSNPDDTKNSIKDYYFRIGNNGQAAPNSYEDLNSNGDATQLTKGYMAMSKDGDLEIRANSLSLTG